ncbi:MAG: hypothetical protein U5K79_23635 [Cyclobacteriaceae bacterium]|nr:hypothetical protein [Cyclobacteriaceae bacterium]
MIRLALLDGTDSVASDIGADIEYVVTNAQISGLILLEGIRGLGELEKRVDSGEMAVAFALYPVSMKQLTDIADSGKIMPPKTTWFEPKLRSGLVVHSLKALRE